MKTPIGTYVHEIYCQHPDCNVRQSIVITKNHGDHNDPTRWVCPGCGKPAKVHWTRTLQEHEQRELGLAIGRVNAAIYHRDHPDGLGTPLRVFCVEDLPDSWRAE